MWHAGKLMALDEGSSPVAMDGDTLETTGPWTFEGKYNGPMTAHPKFDPKTGEMIFFGYMAAGPATPDISYQVVDRDGKLTRSETFKAPYASMVHDFIVTDEHVIFPIFPATIDVERIMKGGPVIAWDPDAGTHIGIMARNAGTDTIRWFKGDPCYVYHPMNAYTTHDGGRTRVVADMMKYSRVPLFPSADGKKAPTDLLDEQGQLVRWTFDLDGNSDSYTEEALTDLGGEFPRLDERFSGHGYRHGYYAATKRPKVPGASFDTLVHIDLASGQRHEWDAGAGNYVHEPVFVRAQAKRGGGRRLRGIAGLRHGAQHQRLHRSRYRRYFEGAGGAGRASGAGAVRLPRQLAGRRLRHLSPVLAATVIELSKNCHVTVTNGFPGSGATPTDPGIDSKTSRFAEPDFQNRIFEKTYPRFRTGAPRRRVRRRGGGP